MVYELDGQYFVVDGHHRVAIAKQLGMDFIDARVTIDAPQTAARGARIRYFVTVTNESSKDYPMSPCADYVEYLGGKLPLASYQLNCQPVGDIAAGGSAIFEMQLDVPRSMDLGPDAIGWSLHDGRIASDGAFETIEIT